MKRQMTIIDRLSNYLRQSNLINLLLVRPSISGICLLFMLFSIYLPTVLNAECGASTAVEASFHSDQFCSETTGELRDATRALVASGGNFGFHEPASSCTGFTACDIVLDPVVTMEESCPGAEDGSISAMGTTPTNEPLIYFMRGAATGTNTTGMFTDLFSGTYTVIVALLADTSCNSRQTVTVGLTVVDCATLPVEFGTFAVESRKGEHILNWNTYAELNNDGFIVERSLDGQGYKKIGWVKGEGTSDKETRYNFSDKNVQSNITYYYRLKQMDFDGKFEYSDVKSAIFKDDRVASISEIFPNPAASQANFQINADEDMSTSIYIYDAVGKLVLNLKQAVNEGPNAVEIDLTPFDNGMYFTKVVMGEKSFYQKFIVKK